MGGFCVFGVSKSACKAAADKAVLTIVVRDGETISLTIDEWRVKRDAMAIRLYEESEKLVRISPEFDAPQFCRDWMAAAPGEIKLAKIMVRGPKFDGGGQAHNTQRRAGDDLARVHWRQPVRGSAQ